MADNEARLINSGRVTKCVLQLPGADSDINLTRMVAGLSASENMFSNSVSVALSIIDNMSLRTHLPIVGGERIFLQWNNHFSEGQDQSFVGRIVGITGIEEGGGSFENYTLLLISDARWVNSYIELPGYIEKKTISDTIKYVWNNHHTAKITPKPNLFVSDCNQFVNVVIPKSWTPLHLYQYVADRANKNDDNDVGYWWYETINGWRFDYLPDLLNQSELQIYTNANRNMTDLSPKNLFTVIESAVNERENNQFEQIESGSYASRRLVVDVAARKMKDETKNLWDWWNKTEHLNTNFPINYQQFTDNPSKILVSHKREYNQVPLLNRVNQRQNKTMFWSVMQNTQVQVTLPGNPGFACGMIVSYNHPAMEAKFGDLKNMKYNGRWLIVAVKHVLTNFGKNYITILSLAKDGYTETMMGQRRLALRTR